MICFILYSNIFLASLRSSRSLVVCCLAGRMWRKKFPKNGSKVTLVTVDTVETEVKVVTVLAIVTVVTV